MSVLSTITSSLPNILNLLQGTWDIQYKVSKRDVESEGFLKRVSVGVQTFQDWISRDKPLVDGFEWKSLDFDSFLDMKEVSETSITQSPVENGSFRSVNKVIKPRQIVVTIAKGGIGYGIEDSLAEIKSLLPRARYIINPKKEEDKEGILSKVVNIISDVSSIFSGSSVINRNNKKSSNLPMEFRIITPFDMIDKMNLVKIDYTFKKDTGRNMLVLFLTFQEVLERSSALKKTYKQPSDMPNENVGRLSLQG